MHGRTKRSLVFVMVAFLVCTTSGFSALAQEKEYEKDATMEGIIVDFVFLRPMGIVSTALGTGFFFASLPFSVTTGSLGLAFKKLVAEPAIFTFARPLGDVNY